MKKITCIIAGILLISCFGASGFTNTTDIIEKNDTIDYSFTVDDLSTQTYFEYYYADPIKEIQANSDKNILNSERDWEIGETIWQYYLTEYDPSPKAIKSIEDINDDGIDDVIVCSEDDHVRCFSGGAEGAGVILWEHEIYAGDVYRQSGLDIIEDVDGDDIQDVVVGAAWGARLIRCISGADGDEIWTHDTHEYGGGGWVYQVNSSYDYNDDGVTDVLAATGDDSSDTGPKRIYCLDGENGDSIWEYPLGGPGFAVIGVEDFTGDDHPDVIAGASSEDESQGYAYGLDGETGSKEWTFTVAGSSVWALEQTGDITDDGIKDVIVGEFLGGGEIFGLDATNGNEEFSNSPGVCMILGFAKLNDVDFDGYPDFVPAHSSVKVTQLMSGKTGAFIWTKSVADQPWNVARTTDISGDSLDDVLVGTLYSSNYCYFLDGTDGSTVHSLNHGQALDAIAAIPDVTDDDSMEMVAGGRDGKLTCYSGGLDALFNDPPFAPTIDGPSTGAINVEYEFTFQTTDPDADDIYYYVDWGDGNFEDWNGPYESSVAAIISHTYTDLGEFNVKAKAKDEYDFISEWSELHPITIIENSAPSIPEIDGSLEGDTGIFYTYTFTSTDPDGNDLSYFINWDDGDTTGWTTPQTSGTDCEEGHKWTTAGTYTIQAKAKDIFGAESDWGTLEITMPRNRMRTHQLLNIFRELFNRFLILNRFMFQ